MDNPVDPTIAPAIVNALDIGVGILLLISAVFAYMRGLVHEVLSIAGWIGAIFATFYGFPIAQPFARQLTTINILADFAAGIIIFVVALVFLSLLTRRISKKVKDSALGAVDRSLGFLFGLARGALIVVVGYVGLGMVYPEDQQPKWVREARSMELIAPGAVALAALIPENLGAITGAGGEDADGKDAKKDKKPVGKRKVTQDLVMPQPKSGNTEDPDGYGDKELQQMDRLHDNIKNQ
ncbi:MAG TPA: CvpA family protein [Rhodospirillales bacterium]|jgi:membrane protein required for colicin V production|nr:CvpA family protein [Rhodospirillales bacterium]